MPSDSDITAAGCLDRRRGAVARVPVLTGRVPGGLVQALLSINREPVR
ncbi:MULTISPECIES: hypothetical protein [unclassified Kitasatospora]|nr:hypothetical protein [Kitasatospora sp. MY 5-36]